MDHKNFTTKKSFNKQQLRWINFWINLIARPTLTHDYLKNFAERISTLCVRETAYRGPVGMMRKARWMVRRKVRSTLGSYYVYIPASWLATLQSKYLSLSSLILWQIHNADRSDSKCVVSTKLLRYLQRYLVKGKALRLIVKGVRSFMVAFSDSVVKRSESRFLNQLEINVFLFDVDGHKMLLLDLSMIPHEIGVSNVEFPQ